MTARSNPAADAVQIGLELQQLTAAVAAHPQLQDECRALAGAWLDQIAAKGLSREAGLVAAALLSASLIGAIADQRAEETGQDREQSLRVLPQAFGLYQAHTLIAADLPTRDALGLPPQGHA